MTPTSPIRSGLARAAAALAAAALLLAGGAASPAAAQEAAPEIAGSSISVSSGAATLELEMEDGDTHRIEFRDGTVTVDGRELGAYEAGGPLHSAWRELLASAMRESPTFEMGAERLRGWEPPRQGASAETAAALAEALDGLLRPERAARAGDTVSMEGPGGESVSLAPGRLSFDRLTEQLQRLERSLGRLDEDAREAAGNLALVVHDDYGIPRDRTVAGNLALLDGELRLGGRVQGDVLVLDGTLILEPAARVEGDVLQVGGDVERQGGRVAGEFLSVRPLDEGAAPAPPPDVDAEMRDLEERIEKRVEERVRELRGRRDPGFFGRITRNVGRTVGGVLGTVGVFLMLGLGGVLCVYFLRPRLEVVADTARHSFGRSFGVGLAGGFLFVPVLLILVVAVITWLVIPFYLVATAAALLGGLLAVSHGAGEMLARRRFQYEWMERLRRSNSYYYVLSGLAALLLPFALAEAFHLLGPWLDVVRGLVLFVAWTLFSVAVTTGFGAVLLSRGGQRRDYARTVSGAGGPRQDEVDLP